MYILTPYYRIRPNIAALVAYKFLRSLKASSYNFLYLYSIFPYSIVSGLAMLLYPGIYLRVVLVVPRNTRTPTGSYSTSYYLILRTTSSFKAIIPPTSTYRPRANTFLTKSLSLVSKSLSYT